MNKDSERHRIKPFTNSVQDVKTKFPKLTERGLVRDSLNEIGRGNGSMSIAQVFEVIVVIVLSAYAGSVVGSVQFADPVKGGTELYQSVGEHY